MKKKAPLLILFLLFILSRTILLAQRDLLKVPEQQWRIQLVAGYGFGEHIRNGFATGYYVGYSPLSILEIGFSFHNATAQLPYGAVSGNADGILTQESSGVLIPPYALRSLTQSATGTPPSSIHRSVTSYGISLGLKPLNLFSESNQNIVIGAQYLLYMGYAHKVSLLTDTDSPATASLPAPMTFSQKTLTYFGLVVDYEYQFSRHIGVGLRFSSDLGSMHYLLATIGFHL